MHYLDSNSLFLFSSLSMYVHVYMCVHIGVIVNTLANVCAHIWEPKCHKSLSVPLPPYSLRWGFSIKTQSRPVQLTLQRTVCFRLLSCYCDSLAPFLETGINDGIPCPPSTQVVFGDLKLGSLACTCKPFSPQVISPTWISTLMQIFKYQC